MGVRGNVDGTGATAKGPPSAENIREGEIALSAKSVAKKA